MSLFLKEKSGEGSNKITLLRKNPYFIGVSGNKDVFSRNTKNVFIPLFVPFCPLFVPSPSADQIDLCEGGVVVFGELLGNVEIDLFCDCAILVSQTSGNNVYIHFSSSE